MDVFQDGNVVCMILVIIGKFGVSIIIWFGIKVIIECDVIRIMDFLMVGIFKGSLDYYYFKVKYVMCVIYIGEFIYVVLWFECFQGSVNVLYGCVGLFIENVRWLFNFCVVGDFVINLGLNCMFKLDEGIGCWCYDWSGWQKFSVV